MYMQNSLDESAIEHVNRMHVNRMHATFTWHCINFEIRTHIHFVIFWTHSEQYYTLIVLTLYRTMQLDRIPSAVHCVVR